LICDRLAERFYFQSGRDGVLLIHGFTGTPWALRDLGWKLAQQGKTVLAPLLPGHGSTPEDLNKTKCEDWIRTGQEAFQYLQQTCDTIDIIGLSAGGTIALNLAAENLVQKLVCLSTPIDSESFNKVMFNKMIKYWPKWHSLCKKHTRLNGYRVYPLNAVNEFYQLLDNTKEKLHRIQCPTLLIHSKLDKTVSFNQMEMIAAGIHSNTVNQIALDSDHHAITLGRYQAEVQKKIIQFLSDEKCVIKSMDLNV
jgi:carboxylesterase